MKSRWQTSNSCRYVTQKGFEYFVFIKITCGDTLNQIPSFLAPKSMREWAEMALCVSVVQAIKRGVEREEAKQRRFARSIWRAVLGSDEEACPTELLWRVYLDHDRCPPSGEQVQVQPVGEA